MLAFIGGGNMAGSLIGGWLAAGHPVESVCVAEPDSAAAERLTARFGVRVLPAAGEAVRGADTVVLAVKPQVVTEALKGVTLDPGAVLLSIAAGVRVSALQSLLGEQVAIVRSMPNTPALYGCGISGLYADGRVSGAARQRAAAVLDAAGTTCWVDTEAQLDAVTAVSGSGPAYVFLLAELMAAAGERLGLSANVARLLADRTVIGAAHMLDASGTEPATLRAQVTSKGGTTAAALESLRTGGIDALFDAALSAAARRSVELGDAIDATVLPSADR